MQFHVSRNRIYVIFAIFAIFFFVIIVQLINLQILNAESAAKEAAKTRTISYDIDSRRGSIYDRNGNVIAYSKDAYNVYANPQEISDVNSTASTLSQYLGGEKQDYINKINNKNLVFSYIKRRVDVDEASPLKKQNIAGIYFENTQMRVYPYGRVAGQIVGSIDIDGNGLCGLELYYDDILRGSSGSTVEQLGNHGMPIPGGIIENKAVINGQDIMIAIDIELQLKLEELLEQWNSKIGSSSLHSIIMDPTNGEIFAAASLPLFDPSDLSNAEEGSTDLKCISTTYEPGSTFKSVAASAILDNNVLTPNSEIYCPSSIEADEFIVKDARDRSSQTFTFKQIMEKSSNVGISLGTERLGFDKYYNKLFEYGIADETGIDYPGDTKGYIPEFKKWGKIHAYNIAFGQGVTITPLQTCKFYTNFANNGFEPLPHFLIRYLQSNNDETYESKEVIKNKNTVVTMNEILKSVVENGTGQKTNIPGYYVAGKTGTGEFTDDNGEYIRGRYYSSFCGYLSKASAPMLCFVGGENTGEDISVTECWKDIMLFAIERFKIAPGM